MSSLPAISPEVYKAYQAEISKNTSPATAKRKAVSLNKFFDWASTQGHIPVNPIPRPEGTSSFVVTPKKGKVSTRAWAIVGITSSMVVLIFLLLYQLKLPIPFIKSFAQESKIQTVTNNNLQTVPPGSTQLDPGTIPANSAVVGSWNLFAKLKLSEADGSPRVGSESITFKLFDSESEGRELYSSSAQDITTDNEGSALISLADVPSNLFFENNTLFLEPQVGSGSATARIPVSTANTPAVDLGGNIVLTSESPSIKAKSGNLLIEGQTVTVKATDGSGGGLEFNPDANGIAHFLFEGNKGNFLNAQGPNLTSGSLYYGMVPNNATGYDLIRLQSGAPKMKTRFSVDALGNTYIAGNENVVGNIATNGTDRLTSAGALQNITGYSQTSGNFTIVQSPGDFASINKTVTSGGALSDVLTLTLDERGKPATSNSDYSTLVLNRYDGSDSAMALLVKNGNAQFNGQLRLGRFDTNPTAIGTGSIIYNSSTNQVFFWDGTAWIAMGTGASTAFSNITSGTNLTATMIVGTGASLTFSGTGTITASDVTCVGCVSNAELANSSITFAGETGSSAIALGATENIVGGSTITTDQTGATLTIDVADDSLDFAQLKDLLTLDAATDIATGGFTLSTSGTGALNFASTGQVTFAGNVDATNGLDVTGSITQNTFGVCDSSGANCPTQAQYWDQAAGALYPASSTVDVLIGSSATTSADFAFTGVNGGLPTASIAGNIANVATYLTGNGTLSTTNAQNLILGSSTTGNVILNSRGSDALTADGANVTIAGDLAVNGGDLTTNQTTFNLINATATTLNFGGAATTLELGAVTGTTSINNALTVDGDTTLGNAITDSITFTGRVAQDSDLIPITTTGTNDLGSALLPWDNIYGVALFQNGNAVCDSSGLNCPFSGGYWGQALGALYPINNGVDLLIGSDSTASAKFAFKNVSSGTPTASIAGSIANVATYLTGDGTLSTTNAQALTLGSSTTGNVILNSRGSDALTADGANVTIAGDLAVNGGDLTTNQTTFNLINATATTLNFGGAATTMNIGPTGAAGSIALSGGSADTGCTLDGTTGNFTCSGNITTTATTGTQGFWAQNLGVLYPINNTVNILFGSSATASADFAFTGINGGLPTASIAGNVANVATYLTGNGTLSTTNAQPLTLGGSTTGNVILNSRGSDALTADGANVTIAGDLAVNGGDLTTNQTTFNLINTTATTLNIGGAATTFNIGPTGASGSIAFSGGSADTGCTLDGTTGNLTCSGNITATGDLVSTAGNLTTSSTGTATVFNTNATTLNIGGDATTVSIGDATGTTTINNALAVTLATNLNGDTTIGNAITDNITFTGRVAQDSDLIPITTTGTNDLGTALLPWDNIYGVALFQNGNAVCDSSGAGCPFAGGYWSQTLGALYPTNSSVDVLIGSDSTASAKFAFINVLTGTPTASISGTTANVATYLTGEGNLATTNAANLTIGGATTGNVILNSRGSTALTADGANVTIAGDLAVNGGDLTTNQTTFNLINATATTLNIGGDATTVSIGDATGTTTINNALAVTLATNLNGDTTIGNAITDNITFTGRVAQDSDLIPITTTGTNDLGTSLLPWDNIYGVALFQNGNAVCDSTGANCPTSAQYWDQIASGVLYPVNSSVDVLIGGTATTSAKFAFINVLTGVPTASIAGNIADVATFLTGNGTLGTTNNQPLNIGNATTGPVIIGSNDQTVNINSSDWDISTVGDMSGIGSIGSDGDWTMTQATPSIFLTDTGGDDYSINVDGNAFDVTNATDTRQELQFVGDGSINFGDNTATKTIDIGGVTNDAADTINIATNATSADIITIGNAHASTTLALTGGTSWSIGTNGNIANSGDLTITPSGGQLILADTATLNVGGKTNVGYNTFANAADAPAATTAITSDNDLFIGGDLELKGGLYLTGKNIYNLVGTTPTATISLATDPSLVDTVNTLGNGSWLVQNDANAGIAALIVNQTYVTPDIFTASAGGTMRFKIANDGTTTILTTNAATVASLVVSDSSGTGTGKIDVGTVDPPYTINGKKFATFLSAMTGVKEETAGLVSTNEYVPGVGYRSIIDFNNLPEGSDLWLFGKTTNIKENMDKLVALLTPSSSTRVWYDMDRINKKLVVYSARPTEISYRLTGPRFDAQNFPNQRSESDSTTGFVINSLDTINNSLVVAEAQQLASFVTEKVQDGFYLLRDSSGTIVDGFESIGNFVAGNIKAGAIQTKEIASNSFNAFQGTVDNLLVSSGLVTPRAQIALISPIPGESSIAIRLGNESTASGKLAVQDRLGTEVASIDSAGNASFSGELFAKNIHSTNLDEIQAMLTQVKTDQDILAQVQNSSNLTATGSANLDQIAVSNLFVTGQAAMNSLSVINNFMVGTDFAISQVSGSDNSGTSLNTLSAPLKIQSLAMAPVELMAGLVTIDTNGNVNIQGNLNVAGEIKTQKGFKVQDINLNDVASIDATGSAVFNSISTAGLIIGASDATVSGVIANGEISTNSTIGKAIIPAETSEIIIRNPKVTDYALVYVTPTSETQNYVLYIKEKSNGYFKVGFDRPLSIDVSFNWWVVEVAQ